MDSKKQKKDTLLIIDMQNDFITGSLANPDAEKIVDPICELIKGWKGNIIATRDTHDYGYFTTHEYTKLPIHHCIKDTAGWCIENRIMQFLYRVGTRIIDKRDAFAVNWSGETLSGGDIYIVGTCTDICVISNALVLRGIVYPDKNIFVYEDLCAGTTPERHKAAIEVMKSCQIDVLTYGSGEKSE